MDWLRGIGTWFGDVWRWLTAVQADAWAASAGWVTALIALATVIVAGKYAHRQLGAALEQVREAQTTRDEQAQPNVVVFMEHNHADWHMLELVVKNFGTTPALNVRMSITPTPQVSAAAQSEDVMELLYPELIPFLAPSQEWRTFWDSGPSRVRTSGIASRHEAAIKFEDSRGKAFTTNAILDWDIFVGTMHVDTKGVHDIAKLLDDRLEAQNKLLEGIGQVLARYSVEHQGIWVYGSRDDAERQFRAERAQREAEEAAES
ncbi:hypothetical protein [Nocardia sp. NPDC049707]|uniref:hypothetical protein n=1 Tax=Nocardia sp. NPDC049707 TaxID=3154735 RepID=UPI00341F92B4